MIKKKKEEDEEEYKTDTKSAHISDGNVLRDSR